MQHKLKQAVIGVLVALMALVGALSPAPAQASAAQCNSANVCLWDGVNYTGLVYQWSVGYIRTLPGDCLVLSGSQSNTASSLAINGMLTTTRVVFFDLAGGGDSRAVTGVSSYWDQDLRYAPGMTSFSNKISSICVF